MSSFCYKESILWERDVLKILRSLHYFPKSLITVVPQKYAVWSHVSPFVSASVF